MHADDAEHIFPIFVGVWIVLGLFSVGFFFLSKNAQLKRKVWPWHIVIVGLLFIGFTWAMSRQAQVMFFTAPIVALITLLNLRAAQFCDACGATLINQNPFAKPAFCSKCGAALKR